MLDLPKKSDAVSYDGVDPVFEAAAPILTKYFLASGLKCVVTSAKDGKHSVHSAHKRGQALDLRSWGIKSTANFCSGIAKALNSANIPGHFFVVWEKDHIHLEWSQKGAVPNIVGYKPGKFFYDATAVA